MNEGMIKHFDTSANCDGGNFLSSQVNSFPDLNARIRFLSKFYQCLLFCLGIIAWKKVAVVTKDKVFGICSMMIHNFRL